MDIVEFLSIDSSRLNADLLVEKFGEEPEIFDTILEVMFRDSYPLSMRAGRVIWLIGKKYPDFVKPYLPELIDRLCTFRVDGIRRIILSLMVEIPLPRIDLGKLFDYCYTALENEAEPVAIRGNAITILYKISQEEPELKKELIVFFESMLPCESTGIETRIKNTLKSLYQETS